MQDIFISRPTEGCLHCHIVRTGCFCDLSPGPLAEYGAIGTSITLPTGAILFSEGQEASYVWTLCTGRAKITTSSREGKILLVKVAKSGDILGLSAALTDSAYEVTAQAIEPCDVKSFHRKDFLHFIRTHAEGSLHAAESLNHEYRAVLNDACRLALSYTIAGRVARLLLEYASEIEVVSTDRPEIHMPLKHEDLASMLGSSRESVTRALNDLRRQGIISIKGTKVTVLQMTALKLVL